MHLLGIFGLNEINHTMHEITENVGFVISVINTFKLQKDNPSFD